MKKSYQKKIAVTAMAGIMALNIVIAPVTSTKAATEYWNDASAAWTAYKANWTEISSNYENVSLTPGVNETELNFAWYSHTEEVPKVKIAKDKEMKNAVEFSGTQANINDTVEGYFSNKVIVKNLEEQTTYYYQVFQNGEWAKVQTYATDSFKNYSILYVGDPQIGACKGQSAAEDGTDMSESGENLAARNDAFNWNQVLTNATAQHDVSFMISAGDQVNTANKENEYAGYLSAAPLASLPVATTIGNHDSKSAQYTYHYNNPNAFDKTAEANTDYVTGSTAAGTDYYYTYGDVLFIVLDTNNYNCATHENVMKKAIEENKDCKWRVVTFHQDIYGSGYDHSDSDGIVLRTQLTPLFDKYDIDVVLQGHDHTYSRTYQLTGDGKEHETYSKTPSGVKAGTESAEKTAYLEQNNCYNIVSKDGNISVNPKGTVYFEANSATGSKFYNLIPVQQDYIAERSQTWTPSYSVIDVSESAITVKTYDASTGAILSGSDTYTIVKEADKADLNKAISEAKAKLKETEKYAVESLMTLQSVVTKTESVATNVKATNKEIAESVGEISKAVSNLKLKTVSKKPDENTDTVTAPKAQNIKTAKSTGAKKIKVTWKKNAKASGYQIKVATNKKFAKNVKTVNIKKASTTNKTISKLKKAKVYYVKMRAYITSGKKKLYGKYGKVKKITVKK